MNVRFSVGEGERSRWFSARERGVGSGKIS